MEGATDMRIVPLVLATAAVFTAGCASSSPPPAPVAPLVGPEAQTVKTAYSSALRCLAGHVRSQDYAPPRVAVGLITDMTGAQDRDNGRKLTQGATLMAITALSEAGVRLVERYDMGVIQVEMDYARSGLVRDSDQVVRSVKNGELQGADVYIIGGLSEFNPNIRSRGVEGFGGGTTSRSGSLTLGGGDYVVDVALDLRMVDARSSEVLAVRSLRKQVVGREIRAGVFAFLDGTVVDIGGGQRAMEPVQTAVRTMVDQIIFEFISTLYGMGASPCLSTPTAVAEARGRASPVLAAGPLTQSPTTAAPSAAARQVLPAAPAARRLTPRPTAPFTYRVHPDVAQAPATTAPADRQGASGQRQSPPAPLALRGLSSSGTFQ
jgi:curli production assembly/transport component CsgG/holdfast attachment protein HfaB